jgi:bacterioferritin-associated ferredoxin
MFVCVCRGITERHIEEAVMAGAGSLCDLKSRLGVADACGRCVECAAFILEEQLARSTSAGRLNLA